MVKMKNWQANVWEVNADLPNNHKDEQKNPSIVFLNGRSSTQYKPLCPLREACLGKICLLTHILFQKRTYRRHIPVESRISYRVCAGQHICNVICAEKMHWRDHWDSVKGDKIRERYQCHIILSPYEWIHHSVRAEAHLIQSSVYYREPAQRHRLRHATVCRIAYICSALVPRKCRGGYFEVDYR